jgi:hypothetical protein
VLDGGLHSRLDYGATVSDRQLLGADPGQRTQKLSELVADTTATNGALADVGRVNLGIGEKNAYPDREDRIVCTVPECAA